MESLQLYFNNIIHNYGGKTRDLWINWLNMKNPASFIFGKGMCSKVLAWLLSASNIHKGKQNVMNK